MLSLAGIAFLQPKYFSVHQDGKLFSRRTGYMPLGIEAIYARVPLGIPFVLRYPLVVLGIDERNLSLRQGNFTIGFKEWECHAATSSSGVA